MTIQEAIYWDGEISDADLTREADAGDFLIAAQAILCAENNQPLF